MGSYMEAQATGAQGGLQTKCLVMEGARLFTIPGGGRQAQEALSRSQKLWEAVAYRSAACRTFLQSDFSGMTHIFPPP